MVCPSCGHSNREGAAFCEECGASLARACPACGAELGPSARFCGACGQRLSDATSPAVAPTPSAVPSAEPTSFAHGRYRVKKLLGEGGKKKVYLAHDTLLDREVAFALIKAEGLDEASRVRIQREAQAMGRMGSHPHIVTVFDLGHEGGRSGFETQPYMVTELMAGGDVEGLLEKSPDHRLPLEQALEVARQVCRGLEFAHGRGIVHRDLKPGNVWLTQDGTAKIGDFGLAVALDRSRLTQAGMMVGTVSYMPPEQALGGEVTARSDLYSLGAMLYEMVCGRPPFLGDDSVAIIGQHINTPPVAPTWHNKHCPRPLEALILRLLAKDPSERPGSAADVLAALDGVDLEDVGAQHAVPLQADAQVLDSLAGGVFVGRQREMGELKAALEDALSGRGRLVTLVGEPGIGKTRTAQELATYAGLRQCQVLWGRCYEGTGAPPFWPWVQAIRSYVQDRDAERLRSEMGAGAADIAEIVSDVREQLPGLQPPPALEAEQARFRLFDSIATFLKSAGRRQPLVLILDDLQWADHPSLLLLEFVAREVANARLLLIGTYRDVEVSRKHPLFQTLGALTRERLFQRVLLRGLGLEDVGRFIELASGVIPPRGLVEGVYRQTEGNPLFVTEVVRLLVQEGHLTARPSTSSGRAGSLLTARGEPVEPPAETDFWTVRIPEGVKEVIGRRLDRLSERCNQTLTTASVIGREFTLEQLKPLLEEMTEDRLLEVLEEALAARVIEELPRSVGRYQFSHALIQETLSQELSTTRRVRLHARIAATLENLYADHPDASGHAAELAHHFAEAQTVLGTDKLVRYSLLAGERALAAYAYEEALAHFQRGLEAKRVSLEGADPAEDAETARLLFGLGRAQAALFQYLPGSIQKAVANFSRAFQYYVQAGESDRAVAIAEYPVRPPVGELSGLDGLVGPALKLAPPNSEREGRLLAIQGRVKGLEEGDYQAADSAFQKALAIALHHGDQALEMRILAEAAQVDFFHLRLPEALHRSLRALELSSRQPDLRVDCGGRFAASQAGYCTGQLAVAQHHAEAMLAAAERLRDRWWLHLALWQCERACSVKGDWTAARRFSDRGLAVAPEAPTSLMRRATLELEVGDWGEAELYLRRLLVAFETSPPGPTFYYAAAAYTGGMAGWITGKADHFDLAQRAAQTFLSSPFATPTFSALSRIGQALIAVVQGDGPACEKLYAGLQPARGLLIISITVDRVLGLLAQTMGHPEKAAEHFEDALAFCRKAGYRPELAWTCCDYAEALLVGARHAVPLQPAPTAGDRRKAMSLLDESLAISRELGMRPLMERVLTLKLKAQGSLSAGINTSIDAVATAVQAERPDLPRLVGAAPDGTVTILFSDIEGSTTMTERLGDRRMQEVLRAHDRIIRDNVSLHQGFEVKSIGDGFMLAFSSARRAIDCAIGIQRALNAYNEGHPGEPIRVRIGLHTGETIKEADDFYGRNVILASRIAGQAQAGQILVSSLLKELTESAGDIRFAEEKEVELKGLSGAHRVYHVVWR